MDAESTSVVALADAVDRAGSQSAFARMVGMTQQAVSRLLAEKRPLGAKYVLPAERQTGISRHDLRPDLYPRDDDALGADVSLEPAR